MVDLSKHLVKPGRYFMSKTNGRPCIVPRSYPQNFPKIVLKLSSERIMKSRMIDKQVSFMKLSPKSSTKTVPIIVHEIVPKIVYEIVAKMLSKKVVQKSCPRNCPLNQRMMKMKPMQSYWRLTSKFFLSQLDFLFKFFSCWFGQGVH